VDSLSKEQGQNVKMKRVDWRLTMLNWALIFLVVPLIAAVLGFSGIAVASAGIAKTLFAVFLVLSLFSIISHLARGHRV